MSVDCELASQGLQGVQKTQGQAVLGREVGGVGVRSLISSLESTLSGSNRTRPAPVKPPWIFLSVIEAKKALQKAQRNSSLLMQLIYICIKSLTQRLYTCFGSLKQLTLSGQSRQEECRGIQSIIMLFYQQQSLNLVKQQLLQLLRINNRYLPFV